MYIVLSAAKYQYHLVSRNVIFLNQGLSLFLEQEGSWPLIEVQLLKDVFPDFLMGSKSCSAHSLPFLSILFFIFFQSTCHHVFSVCLVSFLLIKM